MTLPHASNFCGGNYQDWLEINLLPECNGRCGWCIEKKGFHPSFRADWKTIGQASINTGKKNIILLGGDPTLYKNLKNIVQMLVSAGRKVWIATNGYLLGKVLADGALSEIAGVNVSIHHYDLKKNAQIVGVSLNEKSLKENIQAIRSAGGAVRINCNIIKGHIDSEEEIIKFVEFAKGIGADSVRFAELKVDGGGFVDLFAMFKGEHGLVDDPFTKGCSHNSTINGMAVNFRQMCGLQTPCRKAPKNPEQLSKQVLYYDGHIYKGWQSSENLDKAARKNLLLDLAAKRITVAEVADYLNVR